MTTDTEMVERCVRAASDNVRKQLGGNLIPGDFNPSAWSATGGTLNLDELVRAVLECLRTPTPEMVEAMGDAYHEAAAAARAERKRHNDLHEAAGHGRPAHEDTTFPIDVVGPCFTAAIGRALHPSKGEGE